MQPSFRYFIKPLSVAAALILPFTGIPAWAQGAGDALHIDNQGRVGIGTETPRSALDVQGNIRGVGMVPPGGIVMFNGDTAKAFDGNGKGRAGTPYEGWQLCNGKNGAPNLRDRFIAAAGGKYRIGATGGADAVVLAQAQMPAHSHGASTGKRGGHVHNIQRNRSGTLRYTWKNGDSTSTVKAGAGGNEYNKGAGLSTDSRGDHVHPVTIGNAGGNQPHENRPAFYALAFIMRLP